MSWELWHDVGRNMIADFASAGEALAFLRDVIAENDANTVRPWMLRDTDRTVAPLRGDDLLLAAQLAADAPEGVITLLARLHAVEQRLKTLAAGSA